jgi:hypothetical protein
MRKHSNIIAIGIQFTFRILFTFVNRAQTKTLSITTNEANQWILHLSDTHLRPFDDLFTLAKHITSDRTKMLRISASEYDKPKLLLLCWPEQAMKSSGTFLRFSEQQRMKPCIISDLVLFCNKQHVRFFIFPFFGGKNSRRLL